MTDTSFAALTTAIETQRTNLIAQVNKQCDELLAAFRPPAPGGLGYRMPTQADGLDPQNKNGMNLTPRGVEILYRVFDDGGGYNRAAKMLGITQAAAKNRKAGWVKAGGLNRKKMTLDIDITL